MTIQLRIIWLALLVNLIGVGMQNHAPLQATQKFQSAAQTLPPCPERPSFRDPPWIDGTHYCLETVISDPAGGELAYSALAAAPDGTLYVTRPVYGEVLAITDSNGDALPDTTRVIASDLTLPNGLAYHEGALYITAGSNLLRLMDDNLETLVDDLPLGSSGWGGSLIVGPDDRLYISTSASCDYCVPQQPELGVILSYTLDGSDRQIVAAGLRQAGDMAFLHGDLWATDSARTGLADVPDLDELNRVRWGAHFGWPYCTGMDNQPDTLTEGFDCATATAPALVFPTGSTPTGMVAYTSDTLNNLNGSLLVVLNGSRNQPDLRGYALTAVRFDEQGTPTGYDLLVPYELPPSFRTGYTLAEMNYRGSGFWPHRPLDVTVSPEGWIYLSVGGEILVMRQA